MAVVKTGNHITDIQGGFAGTYFHRDASGLHCSAKPRNVHQRTPAQDAQRKAFTIARQFSKDPRVVSYNIYRVLNNLPMAQPPFDYEIPGM